jgi:exopolysaccharide biosynthesis polyprenyl glycosylphosphotransferase
VIRRHLMPLKAALILGDAITAAVLFLTLVNVRLDYLDGTWSEASVRPVEVAMTYALLWVGTLWFVGLYRLRTHWTLRGELVDVLRAAILLLFISLAVLFTFDLSNVSRLLVAMLFVVQPIVTVVERTALRKLLENLRARGRLRRELLIIGAGHAAQTFTRTVEHERELGLHVMGYLLGPREDTEAANTPILGTIDDIESVLASRVVDEVAICLEPADWSYVEPATRICQEEGKIVRISLEPIGGVLTGGRVEEVGDLAVVSFVYAPDRAIEMALKRAFDIAASALLLVLLSPLLLVVALYVRLRDKGPALFRQQRVGLHGRLFTCIKFRTMVLDADERLDEVAHLNYMEGPSFKAREDPRITPTGRFLRKWSLDELPQLLNVLRGDMSIVGPRPAPPREVDAYGIWHRRRLSMRPGLTGYWQIQARSDESFDRRAELDLQYIDRWSIWLDIKIMALTIPALINQQGR